MLPGEALVVELQLQARKRPSPEMTHEDHRRVMTRTARKIRETSPDRIVIIDGLDVGRTAVMEMTDGLVGQSVHTYLPTEVSHYRAAWADAMMDFPTPEWPARRRDGKGLISRETLEAVYEPWGQLVKMGVGVHAGESGCYIKTPHPVFLSWMHDVLDILKGYNIGWGLWNFRGNFGVLDSGREDVAYEDWHGHKMDRKLMTLLQYN
jgi:endoglucanase